MKKYRLVNKKRFAKALSCVIVVGFLTTITIDFICYPECYINTWRYQLKNEIKNGDADALKYYQETYISNGREL
jgi:hypothetical protein